MTNRHISLPLLVAASVACGLQQHSAVVDPDGDVWLHWTPDQDSNIIEMRVEARTRGWVAVGFSPSGGMKGADIIMGWVSDGKVHVQDMYAEENGQPFLDPHSDIEVLGGKENDTHTVFTIRRPLKPCDTDHDVDIGTDTTRLIWALHVNDPSAGSVPPYHGPNRGVRSISLDGAGSFSYPPPGASESFSLEHNGTKLPAVETFYHCSIHRLPDFGGQKVHYTGYRVKLAPETLPYVHHFVLYSCTLPDSMHETFEEFAREHPGAECYNANMPQPWTLCRTLIIIWAIGGEGEMLPDNVGIELGHKHGGATYFLLESHYDNPHRHSGLSDFSGLELFFTRSLRPVEGVVATIGHEVTSSQMIPPRQKHFITTGACPGQCTEKYLPAEGVRVHAVMLHSHLAGRTMTLRHIRDGKELPPLAQDMNYDVNFQQSRAVRGGVRILPGDSLLLECGYNTENRDNVTMGGFGTREEMCLAFVTYYPRTPIIWCTSALSMVSPLKSFGLDRVDYGGYYLPVETAADLWIHSAQKYANDIRQTALGFENTTKLKGNPRARADSKVTDWFNRAELKSLSVFEEKGSAPTPLYEFLKHADWSEQAVQELQRENFEGLMYGICSDQKFDTKQHYTEQFSGPWRFQKFERMVAKEWVGCSAQTSPSLTGTASATSGQELSLAVFGAAGLMTVLRALCC